MFHGTANSEYADVVIQWHYLFCFCAFCDCYVPVSDYYVIKLSDNKTVCL